VGEDRLLPWRNLVRRERNAIKASRASFRTGPPARNMGALATTYKGASGAPDAEMPGGRPKIVAAAC